MNPSTPISSTPLLRRHPEVVFRDESKRSSDDAGLLYHPETDRAFSLNATGVVLWQHLEDSITRDDLLNTVLDRFDSPPAEARAVLSDFLDELLRRQLIVTDA